MAIFTEDQIDTAEDIIANMSYKVHNDLDSWYPTKKDISEHITGRSKNDALFLIWLTNPAFALSPDQEEVRKYARKLLYRHDIVTIKSTDITENA